MTLGKRMIVAALGSVLLWPLTSCAQDWPAFRGAAGDAVVKTLPAALPDKPAWTAAMGGGQCAAGIAAAEGVVVVPDYAEGKADYYRALDPSTGKELWVREFPNDREMDYGAGPRATPLIYKGKVYVISAFGEMYCFDLKSGKTIWEKKFKDEYGVDEPPQWGFSASPLVVKDKIIINPGGKGGLVALDPENGKQIWSCPKIEPNYTSFIAGEFGGIEQIVGIDAGSLGGWDVATGKRLWKIALDTGDGYIVPTPVKVGGNVLVANTANGAKLFKFGNGGVAEKTPVATAEQPAPEMFTPVVSGDIILGSAKALTALNAKDLSQLWTQEEEATLGDECHLIVAGDKALAVNGGGRAVLFTFNKEGMKVVAKGSLCKATMSHPAIANNMLFIRDQKSAYGFNLGK